MPDDPGKYAPYFPSVAQLQPLVAPQLMHL